MRPAAPDGHSNPGQTLNDHAQVLASEARTARNILVRLAGRAFAQETALDATFARAQTTLAARGKGRTAPSA